jgi:hypothetical protein
MIKFNTRTGMKHLNIEAKRQKEIMQPSVRGMHCTKCSGIDTEISFEEASSKGALPNVEVKYLRPVIVACCNEFEQRVRTAAGMERHV